ncbi:MAG: hypothetical protein M3Y36_02510, partial [Actinomycetota bacterium]|nr:hypothetical protein [Actinomycetota bacterium]
RHAGWARRHRLEGPAHAERADARILDLELAQGGRDALDTLADLDRTATILAFYGHYTYRHVAVILGQPEGTVKSRIRAGLKQLRDLLVDADVAAPAG